jgi:hypothetical protein
MRNINSQQLRADTREILQALNLTVNNFILIVDQYQSIVIRAHTYFY